MFVGQQDPGRGRFEQFDAARCQHGQHIDHVEIVDERVDDLDEGGCGEGLSRGWPAVRHRLTQCHTPSPGSSRSSARRSRRATISAATTPTGRPWQTRGHGSARVPRRSGSAAGSRPFPTPGGSRRDRRPPLRDRRRARPSGAASCRLSTVSVSTSANGDAVVVLRRAEFPLVVLVERQHADPGPVGRQWIGEDCADPGLLGHVGEGRPAGDHRHVEPRGVHRSPGAEGVLARALTHGELQVLERRHPLARHAQQPGLASTHDRDPGTGHGQHVDTRRAQARSRRSRSLQREGDGDSRRLVGVHVPRPSAA